MVMESFSEVDSCRAGLMCMIPRVFLRKLAMRSRDVLYELMISG
jgi:hypothetical protein